MHLHIQTQILGIIVCVVLDGKGFTVGIPVGIQRKRGKRDEVDSISFLQRIQIAVSRRHAHNVGDAGEMSARSSHPHDVVVAPLDVDRVVLTQRIQDHMRSRSSVKNVAHDMQMIDDQPLDQVAERYDKFLRPSDADDRVYDLVIVGLFVLNLRLLRDQLFDDIGEILWQRLAHLGSGIFRGHPLGDLYQTMQGDLIPVLDGAFILLLQHDLQLFARIIDQRRQTLLVFYAQRVAKLLVDLAPHGAGTVFQHVVELLILSVDIRHKVFRALGQIQDCLQIDDLRRSLRDRRILFGKAF